MQLSIRNSKVFVLALAVIMISSLNASGMFFPGQKAKQGNEIKDIRLSSDILNELALTEKWVIYSLGGGKAQINNIEKSGNNLLVFNSDSALFCINLTTGGVKWEKRLPQRYGSLAQISFYQDRVLMAVSNHVFEFALDSGIETNHWELPFMPTTSIARDEDMLFVGATDDRFYCLKLPMLTQVWKSRHSQQPNGKVWLDTRITDEGKVGNVYYTCDNGSMYAALYDQRKLLWTVATTGDIAGSVFDNGQCFIASTDTALYCLNADNGGIFWKYLSGGKLFDLPVVTNEHVYQAVQNRSLVCLERYPQGLKPQAGAERLTPAVRWELKGGTKFICEAGERVFTANSSGQMVVMNNRTGQQEVAVYLPGIDVFFANTQDDMLILADKTGNIMVLQPSR